jgi:hypothetical protein
MRVAHGCRARLAYGAAGHALRVDCPRLEARADVAALALLEVAEAGRDVRPAMARRLGGALRQSVGLAEALVVAEVVELAPLSRLAQALMVARGEFAGAIICRLSLVGPSRARLALAEVVITG